jgi:hypothetical protein
MTVARADEALPLHRRLPGVRRLSDGSVLYWWAEIAFVLAFYFVYSAIRNSNEGSPGVARANAIQLMGWQETLGINHEHAIHRWALEIRPLRWSSRRARCGPFASAAARSSTCSSGRAT